MRKVILELTIKVIVNLEEDETVEEFIDDTDYNLIYCPDGAENRIEDVEVLTYDISDSK